MRGSRVPAANPVCPPGVVCLVKECGEPEVIEWIIAFDSKVDYSWLMREQLLHQARAGRRVISVTTLAEAEREDRDYWRSRTPDERLTTLELSRQIAYGYDSSARRLSRFFEVVEFTPR